jgi:two-component system CheB/CheR fusion protein
MPSPGILESKPGTKRSGLRILVLQDKDDGAISESLLRLTGHEVEVAHDGQAALALADMQEPNVLLLDIGLPGSDGCQVARLLEGRATEKKPFVIAFTDHPDAVRQSVEAGIDLHLLKPVDPLCLNVLLRRFQRVIL